MPDPVSNNNVANVSVGKPKITGAIYNAPLGSTLPTGVADALDSAFNALGYVSEDGVTNTNTPETDTVKAWGGDVVQTTQTSKADKFKFKLLESLNSHVLSAVYGSDNVSGNLDDGLTVHANSKQLPASAWVIDMILTGGILKRIVIPEAEIAEVGDIVYKDNDVIGYDLTLNALPHSAYSGDTHREFLKKPAAANNNNNQ